MALASGMMEAACTSEMSVNNYFTRQYIPEDNSELHIRLCLTMLFHIFVEGDKAE
jgi:hypothetical protein